MKPNIMLVKENKSHIHEKNRLFQPKLTRNSQEVKSQNLATLKKQNKTSLGLWVS